VREAAAAAVFCQQVPSARASPRASAFNQPIVAGGRGFFYLRGRGLFSRLSPFGEMAKSTSKRTLKSFFSRSEVNLHKSAEKDTNDDEKSKFRLLKLKKRTKSEPYLAKAANESQQILRYVCRTPCLVLDALETLVRAKWTQTDESLVSCTECPGVTVFLD